MVKKGSNPFVSFKNYLWSFGLVTVFFILLFGSQITLGITGSVAEEQRDSCVSNCNRDLVNFPPDLERCLKECDVIVDATLDALKDKFSFFKFFDSLSTKGIAIGVTVLAVGGFFLGWGVNSIFFNKKKKSKRRRR